MPITFVGLQLPAVRPVRGVMIDQHRQLAVEQPDLGQREILVAVHELTDSRLGNPRLQGQFVQTDARKGDTTPQLGPEVALRGQNVTLSTR